MGQSERTLSRLGKHVAERQDRAPEAQLDQARGRARLVTMGALPPDPRQRVRVLGVLAPLAAALLVAALVLVLRPREAVRFELGAAEAGVVGAWIAAPPGAELPMRFSDGSMLRLAPGGRARVAAVDANGAEVALERGSLDLSVVHRDRTRWTVRVGPFQVHVIGTRFETHWDPMTEQFGVALREGAITVSGPVVGEGRAVRAGERLTVTVTGTTGTLEVGSIDAGDTDGGPAPAAGPDAGYLPGALEGEGPTRPSSSPSSGGTAVVGRDLPVAPGPRPEPEPTAREMDAPEPPRWRTLAHDARYKDALAAAEREGFEAISGSASASDLRALGDAARLGGSPGRALQAFQALRARFPGSPEAAAATFMLGRIAQDQSRDYAGAAGWFTRYLSEQPGGAFAAEALGRLVEVEDRQGDAAGARRAAGRYLTAYPGGSHAGYARRVLGQAP